MENNESYRDESTLPFGRRTFVKTLGVGVAGATLFGGSAAAHPEPSKKNFAHTHFGDGVDLDGDGHDDIWTFATTNEKTGEPMMLGIWMTKDAFEEVTGMENPNHYHLELPSFPSVASGNNFTFAGIDWNPQGHPPAPVWTVPHFDFHFYLMDMEDVEAIPLGAPMYSLPDEMHPEHYVFEDPRTVVPAMGEHMGDERELSDDTATHTLIYGAYDPAIDPSDPMPVLFYLNFMTGDQLPPETDPVPEGYVPFYLLQSGDGEGELTFVEPMVTEAFMRSQMRGRPMVRKSFPTPEVFAEAGYYPTEYVVRYRHQDDAYVVTLEEFEWFDGYDVD